MLYYREDNIADYWIVSMGDNLLSWLEDSRDGERRR